jgi:iduronate 2-sulfatase
MNKPSTLPPAAALAVVGLLASTLPSLAADASQPVARPNVLFIAVDDLRTSLGCYGDSLAKSPNIDALARSSRLFTGAYTHQAVCGPARAAMLTGRLPDNTRVWHNRHLFRNTLPDAVTLPQLFKNHGYRALSFGKIFSGDERELDPPSWSAPEILRGPGPGWKNYALAADRGGKGAACEAADVPDDGYPDGRLAQLAVETLEKLKQEGQPFFLAVGFLKPHLPFNAPRKYWDLYDPAVFTLQDGQTRVTGAPQIAYHTHRELGGYKDMPRDEHVSADQARTLRHGYYACVSYVDAQVGKLLEALHRFGLDQNTIIVLWGDHGYALGEKDRWCKGTNFEGDTRVPLMIRTPGLPQPGAPTDALIEYVDVYPTLAALVGLTPPADLDGRSFVPVLRDPNARGRDAALSQFIRPWKAAGVEAMGYSLRTATQRYTRWVEWPSRKTIAEEFYDYSSQASAFQEGGLLIEQENVVAHPAYADSLNRLRAKLDETFHTRVKLQAEETTATVEPQPKNLLMRARSPR